MCNIRFNQVLTQPAITLIANHLYFPIHDRTYPMAFQFNIPDGDGSRAVVITTDRKHLSQGFPKRVAAYLAFMLEVLYPDFDYLPAGLADKLEVLIRRDIEMGAPVRDFSFQKFTSSGAYAYMAHNCGGTYGNQPLHGHLS